MADRGRKVSSAIVEERWQAHCNTLHKQRLKEVRASIDMEEPQCSRRQRSGNPKRAQMLLARQLEINLANRVLLERLIRIRETNTTTLFRPFLARSTFQTTGVYCDPASGMKCVDHINSSCMSSPRSIHYTGARPGSAVSPAQDMRAQHAYMQTLNENSKLLSAISGVKSEYNVEALEMQHAKDRARVSSLSHFRGPESARYRPSSSLPTSPRIRPGSAYLPEGWRRASLQSFTPLGSARAQSGGALPSRTDRSRSIPEGSQSHRLASGGRQEYAPGGAGPLRRAATAEMAEADKRVGEGEAAQYSEDEDQEELDAQPLNSSRGPGQAASLPTMKLDLGTIQRQGDVAAHAASADEAFDALVDGVVEDGGSSTRGGSPSGELQERGVPPLQLAKVYAAAAVAARTGGVEVAAAHH